MASLMKFFPLSHLEGGGVYTRQQIERAQSGRGEAHICVAFGAFLMEAEAG
jgi:hypothetical protein